MHSMLVFALVGALILAPLASLAVMALNGSRFARKTAPRK
jgi:hypothetical protein